MRLASAIVTSVPCASSIVTGSCGSGPLTGSTGVGAVTALVGPSQERGSASTSSRTSASEGATLVVADEDAVPSALAAQPASTLVSRRAHTAARAAGRGERMGTVSRSGRGLATRS